jgi:hypothetical protein
MRRIVAVVPLLGGLVAKKGPREQPLLSDRSMSCLKFSKTWDGSQHSKNGVTVSEAWDDSQLKFTFRRTVTQRL